MSLECDFSSLFALYRQLNCNSKINQLHCVTKWQMLFSQKSLNQSSNCLSSPLLSRVYSWGSNITGFFSIVLSWYIGIFEIVGEEFWAEAQENDGLWE